ncbi:MAG: hypothetical protein JWN44_6289 [Myxococcales bacterium]|nr:hypothetical protein [Myxococcales bacterium]
MKRQHATYYAEIQIIVDGWPWNLSEFDFRRWFAPGSCPSAVEATEIADETRTQDQKTQAPRVSENRRLSERRAKKSDRRKKAA